MISPHIVINHIKTIPEEIFSEFKDSVLEGGFNLQIESRESEGAYASIEWLIPTAVIVYISKSYFDGFLNEVGKDHYIFIKKGFNKLWEKFFGASAPNTVRIGSKGKVSKDQPYSFVFSILAEAEPHLSFKLLIQTDVTEQEYEYILDAFIDFIVAFHSHTLSQETIVMLKTSRAIGGVLLLAYNRESELLEPVDPIPKNNKLK
ncbi:MAG: hypothetical protein CTY33_02955 [Methylotenera sp.]|nr:MAG: hypothetical protein CTY33_02955 [Methylotenera sp.]